MNLWIRKMLHDTNEKLEKWMSQRPEMPQPENIRILQNIPYLPDGAVCHRLDVYLPKGREGPLPVIVSLHGGGMVLCTKEVNRPLCIRLAQQGYCVFCVEYPLVPKADLFQILQDVARGLDRVAQLIGEYDCDLQRVFLVGDSAGAFLSVYSTVLQRSPEAACAAGVTPTRLPVRGIGTISGMFYTAKTDQYRMYLRKDFYGKHWHKHPFRQFMDPCVPEVAGVLPSCFLITSQWDYLKYDTLQFYKALQRHNVPCQLLRFPGGLKLTHDFVMMYPDIPEAQDAIDRMCRYFETV